MEMEINRSRTKYTFVILHIYTQANSYKAVSVHPNGLLSKSALLTWRKFWDSQQLIQL